MGRNESMIKDDSLYQVLLKHNFSLFKGNMCISDYLENHLKQYCSDIIQAKNGENKFLGDKFFFMLEEEFDTLSLVCDQIIIIIKEYCNGHIRSSYNRSAELFDRIKHYFITRLLWNENGGVFYRIRQGDFRIKEQDDRKKQKAELFHIKMDKRSKIGAYRYSVAGYPCLYLATDRELTWFESGMPKQFSYCQMTIDENDNDGLKLIDLSNRPVEFLSSISCGILNKQRQNKDASDYYKLLIDYIITYPIAAACSVKVQDRSCKFVEEYIFPQLLMHWVRESDDIDGIRYKSALDTGLVNGMGAVNITMPVKELRDDGLDKRLTDKILVSDIEYLDVNKYFGKYKDILGNLNAYKNKLQNFIAESPFCGDYVLELIDFCDCIIDTYTALMNGAYTNNKLIFTYLDRLYEYERLLYNAKQIKIDECKEKLLSCEKDSFSLEIVMEHFNEFHELAEKILRKHTVFDFNFENHKNLEKI